MTIMWEPLWRIIHGGLPGNGEENGEPGPIRTGNLIVIAKVNDGVTTVALRGAVVDVMNMDRQTVAIGTTDEKGMWSAELRAIMYIVACKAVDQTKEQGLSLAPDTTRTLTFVFMTGGGGDGPGPGPEPEPTLWTKDGKELY